MKLFGLVGFPLRHSFSKKYFETKFQNENISDCSYQLFEIQNIENFKEIWKNKELMGVNVTVPHKEKVIPYLDALDKSAEKIQAVNVIKKMKGKLIGFNTDYLAFKETLKKNLSNGNQKAMVLGTGGASKAVKQALISLEIPFINISRNPSKGTTYTTLSQQLSIMAEYSLLINTTPLGTFPKIEEYPDIPYHHLTSNHFLYDLVYNPEKTQFLLQGEKRGCRIKNGLEMLHLQAEMSWEIWNSK